MENIIIRNYSGNIGTNAEHRTVFGYAVRFDEESQNLGFYETIKRGAITEETLSKSDIYARFNHRDDAVLARSRYGNGSLHLELREDGLYYEFEAPHTQWGDELLEHISRGDIQTSSFAFVISQEEGAQRWYKENGDLKRTIYKIDYLTDVSPTFEAAYLSTSCSMRSKEAEDALAVLEQEERQMVEEEIKEEERELTVEEEKVEEPVSEEPQVAEQEEVNPSTEVEEKTEEQESTPMVEEEPKEEVEEEKINNRNNININTKMEKFSLLKTIRSVAEGRSFDAATQEIINAGKAEMRANGFNTNGQIVLPSEVRSAYTVTDNGDYTVETEYQNILEPLRNKLVFAEAGAHFMNNLKGDVLIPNLTAQNVGWADECEEAANAAGEISGVTMSPKRLTAFVHLSRKFLMQDSVAAEEAIRKDLVNAVAEKLEATILSDVTNNDKAPKGIYDTAGKVTVSEYADICDAEADIEDANIKGNCVYVMSNKAKAALRGMIKGTNNTGMVYEGGEVDGTKAINTSALDGKKFIYGDFSNLYIGSWGATSVLVDPYTLAGQDCVRLVINAYFDAVAVRPEAFVSGEIA